MFDAILSGSRGEAPRESRAVWEALGPPTFARLPGFRIYPVRTGCPALRFTWLSGSFCPVIARSLASGQFNSALLR